MLYQQPQVGPYSLDKSNPIVKASTILVNAAQGSINQINGAVFTNQQPKVTGIGGIGLTGGVVCTLTIPNVDYPYAMYMVQQRNGAANWVGLSNGSNDNYFSFIRGDTSGYGDSWSINDNSGASDTTTAMDANGLHTYMIVARSATDRAFFIDGNLVGTSTVNCLASYNRFNLGGLQRTGYIPGGVNNLQLVGLVQSLIVSNEMAKAFTANPWQLYADEDDEDVWAPAGAGAGVTGALAWLEANDVMAIAATALVSGAASWTESNDSTAIGAQVKVSAAIAWSEVADATSIAAALTLTAAAAWTEVSDTVAIAATATVAGLAAWVETPDVTSISAIVGNGVSASIAWAEASDTTAIAAVVKATGSAAWTEQADATFISVSVGTGVAANLAWVEQNDATTISATIRVAASIGWAEQSDLVGFSAQVLVSAGIGWAEQADVVAIAALVSDHPSGVIAWTEAPDVVLIIATSAATPLARAPAGGGYAPHRIEQQTRPATSSMGSRPASTQGNDR